ncbi:MAG: PPC domain-containing DNA-binding protein [Ginsengibacter sp.]
MKYQLINNDQQKTFAVILETGEEVMEKIMEFATKEKISTSQFTGIGAFSETTAGFFDFSIRDYKKISFKEQMEVLALNGDITTFQGEYKIHAHVILGKEDGTAHGGHLLKATVHPTLEIILNESPAYLSRKINKESGLALINI